MGGVARGGLTGGWSPSTSIVPMTMQPRPRNPIEARKQAVRRYSRNTVLSVGGGVVGGVALALLFSSSFWLFLGLTVAVVGGVHNWRQIQKTVNKGGGHGA